MGIDEASESPETAGELSHDAIRDQLNRILEHREFHATDKMRDLLRFVVEQTLDGRKHRIKGYTIATQVFGRSDDFNAAQDPIVSIQARRLRRALERYYLVAGGRDPIHIDIPKGRYVPRFAPQVAELAASRAAVTFPHAVETLSHDGPVVAVVPLHDLTSDAAQPFQTIGLTNELVTELTRFQDIVVISCHEDAGTVGPQGNPVEGGRDAGARFVLHGTVRRDVESVRVSMQLTDARDGRQLWAEAYTHPLEASRLIATQEEIARKVVATIGSEYGIIARRLSAESRKKPPAQLGTYEAMLRYYTHQIDPSPESGQVCFVALQRAAEREPEYGSVWSALATLHCQMYTMDVPGFEESLDTALRLARRGVSLEPGSQLGRLILAYACYLADDSEGFHQEIETALALNPNSPYTVGTAGYFHLMQGDIERGLPLLDWAIAVNPCHPRWFHAGYVFVHVKRSDYERALHELETHRPVLSFFLPAVHAALLGKLGRADEAKDDVEQLKTQKPDFASRMRELFQRSLKVDPVIDDLIDGLQTAGLSD